MYFSKAEIKESISYLHGHNYINKLLSVSRFLMSLWGSDFGNYLFAPADTIS